MSTVGLIVVIIIGLIVLGAIVICVYAWMKGTDDTKILVEKVTPLKLESITSKEAVFSLEVPMVNAGCEDAAIIDVFARPYLPQEQFNAATVFGHVETIDRRRKDNYFEALILQAHAQKQLILTLRFVANGDITIEEALQKMVDMDVAIYYNGMARKEIYIRKAFITIFGKEIKALVGGAKNDK